MYSKLGIGHRPEIGKSIFEIYFLRSRIPVSSIFERLLIVLREISQIRSGSRCPSLSTSTIVLVFLRINVKKVQRTMLALDHCYILRIGILSNHRLHCGSDITVDKNEINCADYRFVYMGVKGTWTPLHADVFRSYSWSANVCGKKLWLFLPPSQCHLIFDRYLKNSVYDVHGDICEKKFPGFNKAVWWECTQEQNEIVFVPSGWYHQVHNLEDTISINHNWFNGHNLSWVWDLLMKDYIEAREYIEDIREICDDFESLCQRNLAANTGMNYNDFFIFITRFALANLAVLRDLIHEKFTHLRSLAYHVLDNMRSIHSVALSMVSVGIFPEENSCNCSQENFVMSDARRIMEDPDFHVLCTDLGIILRAMCDERHQDYTVEHMPHRAHLSNLSDSRFTILKNWLQ